VVIWAWVNRRLCHPAGAWRVRFRSLLPRGEHRLAPRVVRDQPRQLSGPGWAAFGPQGERAGVPAEDEQQRGRQAEACGAADDEVDGA
jgi:hypothetical protein